MRAVLPRSGPQSAAWPAGRLAGRPRELTARARSGNIDGHLLRKQPQREPFHVVAAPSAPPPSRRCWPRPGDGSRIP